MRGVNIDFERLAVVAREKRKEKGLTQKGLGERFGLSQTYVGWLELGNGKRLGNDKLGEILAFLGIDIAEFSVGKEPVRDRVEVRGYVPVPEAAEKGPGASVKTAEREPVREKGQQVSRRSGGEPWTSGKEKKRFWEWLNGKTRIGIKLINGEVVEGFIKWYDTYSLKFVTLDHELVIPKHSVLYFIDAPKEYRREDGEQQAREVMRI